MTAEDWSIRPTGCIGRTVVAAGGAEVACGFRDHALSDLIGFVYAGWSRRLPRPRISSARLVDAGRQATARDGGEEPTIFVILDGENAWEHFEGGGRPFLRALYRRLSRHPELRTVTMAEACAAPRERLQGIFPGSWIDANFYIWIGHADDQRAWSQVADARQALDEASDGPGCRGRWRAPVRRCSSPKAATGAGGTATTTRPNTTSSSTSSSGVTSGTCIACSAGPFPDELFISNISTGATPTAHHGADAH